MRRAFLIVGPESAGNRLLARILISAGCFGDGATSQRLDNILPDRPVHDQIVWIRSFPHGAQGQERHWPSLPGLCNTLLECDYHPHILVTHRQVYPMAMSQVKAGHVYAYEDAESNIRLAYTKIYGELARLPVLYTPVVFEDLILSGQTAIDYLLPTIGLEPTPFPERIMQANYKWYQGEGNG